MRNKRIIPEEKPVFPKCIYDQEYTCPICRITGCEEPNDMYPLPCEQFCEHQKVMALRKELKKKCEPKPIRPEARAIREDNIAWDDKTYAIVRDGKTYTIEYYCPKCKKFLGGWKSERACFDCRIFFDWGEKPAEVQEVLEVVWH